MSANHDPFARKLAAAALTVALCALVMAGWAVVLGQQYVEDVETLGRIYGERDAQAPSLAPPPLQLDD